MIRISPQFWLATCYSSDLKCVPPPLEIVQFLLQFLCVLHPPPHQLLTLRAQLLVCLLVSMNVTSYTLQEKNNAHGGMRMRISTLLLHFITLYNNGLGMRLTLPYSAGLTWRYATPVFSSTSSLRGSSLWIFSSVSRSHAMKSPNASWNAWALRWGGEGGRSEDEVGEEAEKRKRGGRELYMYEFHIHYRKLFKPVCINCIKRERIGREGNPS